MGSRRDVIHILLRSRRNHGYRHHMLGSSLGHSLCDGRVLVLCILPCFKLYLVVSQPSSTRLSPLKTLELKGPDF